MSDWEFIRRPQLWEDHPDPSPIWDPCPLVVETSGTPDPVLSQETMENVLFHVLLIEIMCGRVDEKESDPLYDDLGGES